MIRPAFFVAFCWGAASAQALELELPAAARVTVEISAPLDSIEVPLDVFANGTVPVRTVEGSVTRKAWRLDGTTLTPLQVLAPLRDQIAQLGYDVVFECTDTGCGGFDFRFGIEVLPGPNMYVNIRAYRYLTAVRGPVSDPDAALTLLVSKAAASAYVQLISVTGSGSTPPVVTQPTAATQSDRLDGLVAQGRVVLSDLTFGTGNSQLGEGPFSSLQALADFLNADPDARVALVGHTDIIGGLAPNIELSRQRAQSVRSRLVERYDVPPERLDAEGMGYLAPISTNRTAEGRRANRRVEAVLLD